MTHHNVSKAAILVRGRREIYRQIKYFRDEKATLKMKKTDFQDEKVAVLLRKRGINENFEKTSGKYFQNYAVTMKSSMKGNLKKGEKMVGVLIATHGGFAEGILNAVELIAGKQ